MAQVLLKKVNKIYENGFQAVKDVDIHAEDKEFVVLVGPSGCGKTTSLRMVAGLETVTSGEIMIGDKVVNDVLPKDRDIAMVFQNYALYPHMTVYDNMAFALKLRKYSSKEIKDKVMEVAVLLGIDSMLDRKPKQLSGGQRQRVALGRAIVRQPKVFLFDEPLSNLDAKLRVQMRSEIIKLHKTLATTMIYVTHDQVEAMTMGSKIVVMKDGEVQQIASPLDIYNQPNNLFVAGFIGSPSINQFRGMLTEKEGTLLFNEGTFQVIPSKEQYQYLQPFIGKEIVMAIRPEDLYDIEYSTMAENPQMISTICDLVEPLGNEFIVYLQTEKTKFVARLDPKKLPVMNTKMSINLDMNKAHYFDSQSEICIV